MQENPPYNEKGVLLRVSEGDESAFADLFHRYAQKLKPFLTRYSLAIPDVEEILQETFLRVWLHRDKLPSIDNFNAWIFKVAAREYLTWLRKRLRERSVNAGDTIMENADTHTPFDQHRLQELKRVVNEVVQRLPRQRRKIFELSRNEGLTIAQIAENLSLSVPTVKNVLTTVLKQLREHLRAHGYELMIVFYALVTIP